jgi:hypothetical protein
LLPTPELPESGSMGIISARISGTPTNLIGWIYIYKCTQKNP